MEHQGQAGTALCLKMHSSYRCRHAGACCTAGWSIPVEGPAYERLTVHFGGRRASLFETGGPLPEGAAAVLGIQPTGACVFFEREAGNLCAVHRELGVECLPVACRQFPRIVLQDARGTLISLSHFCPTAASLLRSPEQAAFEIVRAPVTLALGDVGGPESPGALEGLDARHALPPLLRPGMLADCEGYDAWERRALGILAREDLTAGQALGVLERATWAIQLWRPGGVRLRDTVEREFDVASAEKPDEDLEARRAIADSVDDMRVRLALSSVPKGLPCPALVEEFRGGWQHVAAEFDHFDGAIRGYLAARLFGNWVAYHGQGLDAIVEYLQVALAVVKMEAVRHHVSESPSSPWQTVKEAIRSADLLLVHLSDPQRLSRRLGLRRQG